MFQYIQKWQFFAVCHTAEEVHSQISVGPPRHNQYQRIDAATQLQE
jgi:hypothetical protein